MGLSVRSGISFLTMVAILQMVVLAGCAKRKEIVRNKWYIDCCNPGLSYEEKDMCKWAKENPGRLIVQGNNLYEMIWSDCKPGEEPWRKWE